MTITDNGRRSREQLLEEARREVGDGPLPSKTALAKALGTHFNRASEIIESLASERAAAAAERARARREAMSRLSRRKRNGRPIMPARYPFRNPSVPVSVVPPVPSAEPVETDRPEVVQKHPESVPAGVNGNADVPVRQRRRVATWPVVLLGFGATVAIWSGWVDMGRLTGFGLVHPFPGIPGLDEVQINAAITLPFGMETYGAYALYVWLSAQVPAAARTFARRSAIGALVLGALGQVAYHLMIAAGMTRAPWWITTLVACLPVAVLGMGAALRHLVHAEENN